jgi:purine-cytosine permease-like protein
MFWTTYLSMNLSAVWLPMLGAVLALQATATDPVTSVLRLGDSIAAGLGTVAVLIALSGSVGTLVMNTYGGSLTILSIVDSVRDFTPKVGHRALAVAAMVVATMALTYPTAADFRGHLTTFLQVLLYLFAPWTAINLADYFLVRRGVYSINAIFARKGIYGHVNARGVTSYLVGIAAEAPFMASSVYTGALARSWHGVDVAPFIGLGVAGAVYLLSQRHFDLRAESRKVRELDSGLRPRDRISHLEAHTNT